jgi:glycerol-3-phosphate acyltransferase PlsX
MGGDLGPRVTIPASLQALEEYPELNLIIVGDEAELLRNLELLNPAWDKTRITIKGSTQVVAMDELPAYALRGKKDSSMRVALNLVHDGVAQACVSAGNTGALMATARFVLKMLPGVDRPAILFPIPSQLGVVHVLDLGANVDCQADHLFQFAVMGSVLISATTTNMHPRVGLLNVGTEEIKGTEAVKRAAELIKQAKDINYIGFVEGDDIYKGNVDVVVCDGFVGNVALKASEGVAKMILNFAKEEFNRNIFTRMAAVLCKPVLQRMFSRFDTNKYNGASLLGLQGVVIKSHGGANIEAYVTAISKAVQEVKTNVPEKIRETVSAKLGDIEVA